MIAETIILVCLISLTILVFIAVRRYHPVGMARGVDGGDDDEGELEPDSFSLTFSESGYTVVADIQQFRNDAIRSVSMRVKLEPSPRKQALISFVSPVDSSKSIVVFYATQQGIEYQSKTETTTTATVPFPTITDGTWHHVVVTFENDTIRVIIDSSVAKTIIDTNLPPEINLASVGIVIGGEVSTDNNNLILAGGEMRDIIINDVVLKPSMVLPLDLYKVYTLTGNNYYTPGPLTTWEQFSITSPIVSMDIKNTDETDGDKFFLTMGISNDTNVETNRNKVEFKFAFNGRSILYNRRNVGINKNYTVEKVDTVTNFNDGKWHNVKVHATINHSLPITIDVDNGNETITIPDGLRADYSIERVLTIGGGPGLRGVIGAVKAVKIHEGGSFLALDEFTS